MKKFTALFLAFLMLLSLAACANEPAPTAPQTKADKTVTKAAETESETANPAQPAESKETNTPAAAESSSEEQVQPQESESQAPAIPALFEGPALVTTAGQSADGTVAETLLSRAGVECDVVKMAGPDDLAEHKCLVLVAGGSSKGLGQAGIKEEQELARVQELIDAAKAQNIPILALHVGGQTRRGKLSDRFIPDAMEACQAAIILREGDEDSMMKNILEKNGTPYYYIEKQKEGADILKQLFGK